MSRGDCRGLAVDDGASSGYMENESCVFVCLFFRCLGLKVIFGGSDCTRLKTMADSGGPITPSLITCPGDLENLIPSPETASASTCLVLQVRESIITSLVFDC